MVGNPSIPTISVLNEHGGTSQTKVKMLGRGVPNTQVTARNVFLCLTQQPH